MRIAIVAPGQMGAAIGARLHACGARVTTLLEGRSAASVRRAAEAGMTAASDESALVAGADLVLSIVPPAEAHALAGRLAPELARSAGRTAYADCNAVAPRTVMEIAQILAPTGAPFIDIGIVGGPPKAGDAGPRLYASGPVERVADLARLGLDLRPLEGGVGAASALKLAYASITKGFTALGASLGTAPLDDALRRALRDELRSSQPHLFAWLARQVPAMYPKAQRFAPEMAEIARFLGDAPGAVMFEGAAALYERMAKALPGDRDNLDALWDIGEGKG